MQRFATRTCIPLLLILLIGLTGCQDSLVEPTPDALDAPETLDEDAPMTQSEFDKQLAENGMVVLHPKDYEAYGGPLSTSAASKASCDSRSSGDITYEVCSNVAGIVIDNVDFFRVTIDAEIVGPGPSLECSSAALSSCVVVEVPVSVTSSTVRGDGVILQDQESDSGLGIRTTDFVAAYPQADDFSFDHTSDFTPVNDQISVHLSP